MNLSAPWPSSVSSVSVIQSRSSLALAQTKPKQCADTEGSREQEKARQVSEGSVTRCGALDAKSALFDVLWHLEKTKTGICDQKIYQDQALYGAKLCAFDSRRFDRGARVV